MDIKDDTLDEWDALINEMSENTDYCDTLNSILSKNIPTVDLEKKYNFAECKQPMYCEKCNDVIIDSVCNCFSSLDTCLHDDSSKFNFSTEKNHNVSSNSFMSFNVVGPNSYRYQKSLLKTCAKYSSYRAHTTRKDLDNCNYNYKGKKIPKNIIKMAIELFSKIKEHNFVFRGNGKKGVLGACLFYACVSNNITKTPREIANIMNIEERFLSHGDRILQEMNENKIISIPTILRPLTDYLSQYFPILNIPDKYKQFIIDIVDKSEKKNIHILNDSRTTTKCIGAIFLLVSRVKELKHISQHMIIKECNISKSTFIRYYNLLIINYKYIKPVFKKHRIPMPTSWRETPKVIDIVSKDIDTPTAILTAISAPISPPTKDFVKVKKPTKSAKNITHLNNTQLTINPSNITQQTINQSNITHLNITIPTIITKSIKTTKPTKVVKIAMPRKTVKKNII